jgi:phage terminase small subunit
MAGTKGKSGGKREGAGRPPEEPAFVDGLSADDSLVFLLAVQNNPAIDIKERIKASIALAAYQHAKKGDTGKKEDKQKSAETAAGKFSTTPPPPPQHLRAVK